MKITLEGKNTKEIRKQVLELFPELGVKLTQAEIRQEVLNVFPQLERNVAEAYAVENFEKATRWSEKARGHISIQDMQTNHLFNAVAQRIVDLRGNKGNDFVSDFTLAAMIWHCWKRVEENIKVNVLCVNE